MIDPGWHGDRGMDIVTDAWDEDRFAVGQPVARHEDPVLLRGQGRYTDDLNLDRQAAMVVLRSNHAHGILRGIDTAAARAMPGVLAVYTGADLAEAGIKPLACGATLQNADGTPMRKPPRPALATDKVRFVGDAIAAVVAESVALAKEAAEAIVVDIDPLPPVTTPQAAMAADAPLLHEEAPGNLAVAFQYGDPAKVDAAIAGAAHVARVTAVNNRVVICPMEPRAAIAAYDPDTGRYTLRVCSQGVHRMQTLLASALGVERRDVRVLTYNVGGSFGLKGAPFPEYLPALLAARRLGRPVKWTDERSGSFVSDHHGRDTEMTGELALDAEGRILALRVTGYANIGAVLLANGPGMSTTNVVKNVVSVYRTPLLHVLTHNVFTNTTPIGAYRGAGRPESNYLMERLIETAAAETGRDAAALRRLNHVRPEELPYKAASGQVYDSGNFTAVLERALQVSDWEGFPARRAESRARGRLRGRGIGQYLEGTAPPNKEMGALRFEADGTVTLVTGTLDYGQGHATPFAQVLSARLGIPFGRIRLLQSDSDEVVFGGGTGGSRSITATGTAIIEASEMVIDRGRQVASAVLEAAVEDIEFARGRFAIAGTDRGIGLLELAALLRDETTALPPELPRTLDVSHVTKEITSSWPNGCHVAELEVDPETGIVTIARYTAVNDFGVQVNPMLVDGQVHGGIAQGIGQALLEATVYDRDGQFLTGSYMDYALPRADHLPRFVTASEPFPARTNPLGTKGCGEAGCAGSLPSVMNALIDALAPYGVRHVDMPATPEKVWRLIQAAGGASTSS
jgi:carbon-monoxide dehydrogenase large subunit